MANVNHSTLTDPFLHEPKGVAAASSGDVYVADGSGSGNHRPLSRYCGAYIDFDAASPATHTTTTSDTVLAEDFEDGELNGFTVDHNAGSYTRFKYTGTENIEAFISFTVFAKQASGSEKDVQFALFKDGTEIDGARGIRTQNNDDWGSITVNGFCAMSTNSYIDVRIKADASCTISLASAFMAIKGVAVA